MRRELISSVTFRNVVGSESRCSVLKARIKSLFCSIIDKPTWTAIPQKLLVAKKELTLERELRWLDRFDVVILDDIGYVQQSREEMEVLFTFLAERYERKSVIITSSLVFSQWDRIFKDPMTMLQQLIGSCIMPLSSKVYFAWF